MLHPGSRFRLIKHLIFKAFYVSTATKGCKKTWFRKRACQREWYFLCLSHQRTVQRSASMPYQIAYCPHNKRWRKVSRIVENAVWVLSTLRVGFCVTTSWSSGFWSNIWLPCYPPPFRVRALQDSRNILQFLVTSPSVGEWKLATHCGNIAKVPRAMNPTNDSSKYMENFCWISVVWKPYFQPCDIIHDVKCWLVCYGKQSSPKIHLTSRAALSSKNLPRVCLDAFDTKFKCKYWQYLQRWLIVEIMCYCVSVSWIFVKLIRMS